MVEIVPALLSYSKEDLHRKASLVMAHAPALHIDIMDGVFVPNKTIGIAEASGVKSNKQIEYHLMVADPKNYIEQLPGGQNVIYQVHIEACKGMVHELANAAKMKGGSLCIAINPSTPLEEIRPYVSAVSHFLVMAVVPGMDGQKYMPEVEGKISMLRQLAPGARIEVDGGINTETAPRAARAGANRLAAASSIFGKPDAIAAMKSLYTVANSH